MDPSLHTRAAVSDTARSRAPALSFQSSGAIWPRIPLIAATQPAPKSRVFMFSPPHLSSILVQPACPVVVALQTPKYNAALNYSRYNTDSNSIQFSDIRSPLQSTIFKYFVLINRSLLSSSRTTQVLQTFRIHFHVFLGADVLLRFARRR